MGKRQKTKIEDFIGKDVELWYYDNRIISAGVLVSYEQNRLATRYELEPREPFIANPAVATRHFILHDGKRHQVNKPKA